MSIYKITFKYAPFAAAKVKYITADNVDTYSEVATFYNLVTDPNAPPFSSGTTQITVAAFKEWLSIEVVDAIPFTSSQTGDSSEDI